MSHETTAANLLAQTRLFAGLDADTLRGLGEVSVMRRYRRGQIIFAQGDPGDSLFVVAEGRVKVMVGSAEGEEMVLVTLGAPETFGELALVDGGERSATVEATEATELLVLTRSAFFDLMRKRPALVDGLLARLGALIRRLTDQMSDLVFLDLNGRVAKLLLGLASQRGETGTESALLDLPFTQTEIAHMVGGSRQSVNQILRSFEAAGFIEMSGHTVRLLRTEALRRRAGS
jgi:CRP/FNR family cyclic AMP-dependent transcriptional regulator